MSVRPSLFCRRNLADKLVSQAVFGGNMTPPVDAVSRIALEPKKRLLLTLQLFALIVGGAPLALAQGLPNQGSAEAASGSKSDITISRNIASDCIVDSVDDVPELKALEPKFDNRIDLNIQAPGRLYPILQSSHLENPTLQPAPILKRFDLLRGLSRIMQVQLTSCFDSKTAFPGQPVQGVLLEDFRLGEYKIASAGAILTGQITGSTPARTLANASHDASRRFRSRGSVSLQFDEIIDCDGKHIPITGTLVKQLDVVPGKKRWEIRVDNQGRIVKSERALSPERQRTYNAIRVATMVPIPIPGNFLLVNMVAVPLAIGVGGFADPSFAYNKPIEGDVANRRMKGFTYAFVSNLPGAFYVQAFTEKGSEVVLRPGDQLAVNLSIGSKKADEADKTKIALQDPSEGLNSTPLIVPANGGTRLVPSGQTAQSHLLPSESAHVASKKVQAIVLKESPVPGQ
jgi:hypothetical protein